MTVSRASQRARIAEIAANCACNNLRRATRVITNFYDEVLRPTGLRSTQCPLLVVLYLNGPSSINEMAERVAVDRTTLTRNLRPLEQMGLVSIAPGEDHRMRVVTLTDAGREALLQVLPLWERAQREVIASLGVDRFTALLGQLRKTVALELRP